MHTLYKAELAMPCNEGGTRDYETHLADMHFREAEISDQRCRMTSVCGE